MILTNNAPHIWREKALQRRAENKELKKRIKELKKSRDSWKSKAQEKKEINKKIKAEMDLIKKKLKKILT